MLKISSKERGEAAAKRELVKLKLIKVSKEEMKKLNKIVHNKELVENKSSKKGNVFVERNNIKSKNSTFYCCGSNWPEGIQCFACGNSNNY
jgi:hypothetical protein